MAEQNAADKAKTVGVKKYYKDTVAELKKVVWPNREQTVKNSLAVLGSVLVIGSFIWIFDAIFGVVLREFILGIK